MSAEQISEAASRAIEILEAKGWCQGQFEMPDGKVCGEEALAQALEEKGLLIRNPRSSEDWTATPIWLELEDRFRQVVSEFFPDKWPRYQNGLYPPFAFNDDPATTKDDMVLVLKHLSAIEE